MRQQVAFPRILEPRTCTGRGFLEECRGRVRVHRKGMWDSCACPNPNITITRWGRLALKSSGKPWRVLPPRGPFFTRTVTDGVKSTANSDSMVSSSAKTGYSLSCASWAAGEGSEHEVQTYKDS